ncbi:Glycosyltransferase involved in cell wall bisynthesis [Pricia antarctica]|uniref:Glycosyltransferase involved in cell wall bisynthesis n=1 Tax=Pricia antarctica TaxID=641691 RepID=A0A1G6X0R2_9FLAO|nr:DUF1972 domain-containing protein [Pricia antarctica]SDD71691.1 Glycosyltransferase involved in cell wall bisynthesis [Pricia antarctica]
MKIAIIGTVGIPAKYGGFETLAENLVDQLGGKYDFTIYCSSPNYRGERQETYLGARLRYLPFHANGKSSIIYDVISIVHAMFFADVLLILGVSGAFMIPVIKWFTNKKIITNIDGLEWKRDKWGDIAKKYLKMQEKIAVRFSNVTVVDNEGIENHVFHEYAKPSTLIAYGADHVFYKELSKSTLEELCLPKNFAFKVCRIEPENNIHIILEAFGKTTVNLVVVGNWNNSEYGKELREIYVNKENLYLLDPIYDPNKLNELRANCFLYVHGHSAGGTNPSLVEAMYLGLPIVAFDVDYNRYTTNNEALYFKTGEDLLKLLKNDLAYAKNLDTVALKMKQTAKKRYTWKFISESYENLWSA